MVTQLFLAITERAHTGSQKRGSDGAFVDANANARVRTSKYTMEGWHTLTHDIELLRNAPREARLQGWPSAERGRAARDTPTEKDGASAGARGSTGRDRQLAP